ncbi:MAG: hypothetical protein ACRD1S_01470 [Vicinamibacterales bacterium]
MRTGQVLAGANLAACVLFVLLREPAHPGYLADVDEARQAGGVFSISGIDGTIACRNLRSWSEWHGGEALGVKFLEVANLAPLLLTGIANVAAEILGVARRLSACGWSWALAVLFVALSTTQWLLVGRLIEKAWTRLRAP